MLCFRQLTNGVTHDAVSAHQTPGMTATCLNPGQRLSRAATRLGSAAYL